MMDNGCLPYTCGICLGAKASTGIHVISLGMYIEADSDFKLPDHKQRAIV